MLDWAFKHLGVIISQCWILLLGSIGALFQMTAASALFNSFNDQKRKTDSNLYV